MDGTIKTIIIRMRATVAGYSEKNKQDSGRKGEHWITVYTKKYYRTFFLIFAFVEYRNQSKVND